MSAPLTQEHLKRIHQDPKFITMHAHLLASAMEWLENRLLQNTPFTEVETELATAAYALAGSMDQIVNVS